MATERALGWLNTREDPLGLAVFRALFGALMVFAAARYVWMGWVDEILIAPEFHFTYAGFGWVRPPPGAWSYALMGGVGASALALALGVKPRASAWALFALFTWAELIEKAAYLNHYYLVSLLALLLGCVRTDGALALWPERGARPARRWEYTLLRCQLACVYAFAGFAKLNGDWLWRAEPLYTWLQSYTGWPVVGAWMSTRGIAYAMSWGGAAFDLLIWLALWNPRTTRPAYALAVVFHVSVWVLFPIGVFPWVMLASATVFFRPGWARAAFGGPPTRGDSAPVSGALRRSGLALCGLWVCLQIAAPMRSLAYPGPVDWNERGFRFSWRVMLVEKTGHVEYRVVSADGERRWRVYPRKELTRLQHKMLCTQPDMIGQYARTLALRFAQEGEPDVAVYADAFVAFNGRASRRWIDPEADLTRSSEWDGEPWVLPLTEDIRSHHGE